MSQCSTDLGRRMGPIKVACQYSGVSRSSLYILASQHPGLFRKFGRTVLVSFDVLDEILDGLPAAQIKAPYAAKRLEGA